MEEVQDLLDRATDEYNRGCGLKSAEYSEKCIKLCRSLGFRCNNAIHQMYVEALVLRAKLHVESFLADLKQEAASMETISIDTTDTKSQSTIATENLDFSDSEADFYERKGLLYVDTERKSTSDDLSRVENLFGSLEDSGSLSDSVFVAGRVEEVQCALELLSAARVVLFDLNQKFSISYVRVLSSISDALELLNRKSLAKESLEEAISIGKMALEQGCAETASLQTQLRKDTHSLANLVADGEDYDHAIRLYAETARITEGMFGRKSSFYAYVLFDMARVYMKRNQRRAAINFLKEVKETLEEVDMMKSHAYADVCETYGDALHGIGEWKSAIAMFNQAKVIRTP